MSGDAAALSFQAHGNYGNWSIDFDIYILAKILLVRPKC